MSKVRANLHNLNSCHCSRILSRPRLYRRWMHHLLCMLIVWRTKSKLFEAFQYPWKTYRNWCPYTHYNQANQRRTRCCLALHRFHCRYTQCRTTNLRSRTALRHLRLLRGTDLHCRHTNISLTHPVLYCFQLASCFVVSSRRRSLSCLLCFGAPGQSSKLMHSLKGLWMQPRLGIRDQTLRFRKCPSDCC